jgi:glycosyltransferase involved in cell wall biosynthesis
MMLSDYFPPHAGGGVEQVVWQLAVRLAGRGHSVRVLTLRTTPAPRDELLHGVEVRRVPARDLTGLVGWQAAWSCPAYRSLGAELREFGPDIVHAHNLYFRTTEAVAIPRAGCTGRLVVTLHLGATEGGSLPLRFLLCAYEQTVGRLILARSARVICVSKAVARQARSLGVRPGAAKVVPNGVDTTVFHPARQGEGNRGAMPGPVVLFVGRLVPNKGPDLILRAAPAILADHPGAGFVFAGDGPMRRRLERDVERAGLASVFSFVGLVDNVPEVMRNAAVLVRPSTLEGMPLAVLEAMATGLPVVATRVGGTPEVVRDGETGFLFEPGDHVALARSVSRLLADRPLAEAMGAAGRVAAIRHSWESVVTATEAVYAEALAT